MRSVTMEGDVVSAWAGGSVVTTSADGGPTIS